MKLVKALVLFAIALSMFGCSSDVSSQGVKEKEKQIDEASKKLNPTDERSNEQEH